MARPRAPQGITQLMGATAIRECEYDPRAVTHIEVYGPPYSNQGNPTRVRCTLRECRFAAKYHQIYRDILKMAGMVSDDPDIQEVIDQLGLTVDDARASYLAEKYGTKEWPSRS